jgi:hypothetical protein
MVLKESKFKVGVSVSLMEKWKLYYNIRHPMLQLKDPSCLRMTENHCLFNAVSLNFK